MLAFNLPNNDLYFYLFHLSRTSKIKCNACHITWCCNIFIDCGDWKKLSTTLISINRIFFQYIDSQAVQSTFRENLVTLK